MVDDDELVGQLSGDGWGPALAELWDRHVGLFVATARLSTRSNADCEDLLSETFARLAEQASNGQLNITSSFRAYVVRAIKNSGINRARTQRRVDVADEPIGSEVASDIATPIDLVVDDEEQRYIASAFEDLTDVQRQVLWMVEVDGLKPREVAESLGVSANNVSQIAVRARVALREGWVRAHLNTRTTRGGSQECATVIEQLPAYVAGTLRNDRAASLDTHVATCESCSQWLADLRADTVKLRGLFLPIIPLVGAATLSDQLGITSLIFGGAPGVAYASSQSLGSGDGYDGANDDGLSAQPDTEPISNQAVPGATGREAPLAASVDGASGSLAGTPEPLGGPKGIADERNGSSASRRRRLATAGVLTAALLLVGAVVVQRSGRSSEEPTEIAADIVQDDGLTVAPVATAAPEPPPTVEPTTTVEAVVEEITTRVTACGVEVDDQVLDELVASGDPAPLSAFGIAGLSDVELARLEAEASLISEARPLIAEDGSQRQLEVCVNLTDRFEGDDVTVQLFAMNRSDIYTEVQITELQASVLNLDEPDADVGFDWTGLCGPTLLLPPKTFSFHNCSWRFDDQPEVPNLSRFTSVRPDPAVVRASLDDPSNQWSFVFNFGFQPGGDNDQKDTLFVFHGQDVVADEPGVIYQLRFINRTASPIEPFIDRLLLTYPRDRADDPLVGMQWSGICSGDPVAPLSVGFLSCRIIDRGDDLGGSFGYLPDPGTFYSTWYDPTTQGEWYSEYGFGP